MFSPKHLFALFLTTSPFLFYGQSHPTDSSFVSVTTKENSVVFDLKYATSDNFLKEAVYDCNTCFLRYEAATALKKAARKALRKYNLRLKIYDCYRPRSIQKRMFALVPNPEYVADPKKGSIHNRGAAIDVTLVDENGLELDMGTAFDHFGIEASHNYENLTEIQKSNRKKLLTVMKAAGFKPLASEWWHYNYGQARKFNLSDENLCNSKEVLGKVEID